MRESPSSFERLGALFGVSLVGAILSTCLYLLKFEISGSLGNLTRLFMLCTGATLTTGLITTGLGGLVQIAIARHHMRAAQQAAPEPRSSMPEHLRIQRPWTRLGDLTKAFVVVRRAAHGPPDQAIILGAIFPSYTEAAEYLEVLCWKVREYQRNEVTAMEGPDGKPAPIEPPTDFDVHQGLDAPVWSSNPDSYSIVAITISPKEAS